MVAFTLEDDLDQLSLVLTINAGQEALQLHLLGLSSLLVLTEMLRIS